MRSPVLCFASAVSLAVSVGTLAAHPPPGVAQQVPTTAFTAMKYRHIGPLGNRITSVAGVPGDRFTYYAGAASGGLWKTEDGGINWRPVFDTDGGELWRSDDGGHNWALISHDRDLAGRTAYYTRCEVNPHDPDEAYFLAAAYSTTLDGGVTSSAAPFLQGPVWDPRGAWHSVGGGGP